MRTLLVMAAAVAAVLLAGGEAWAQRPSFRGGGMGMAGMRGGMGMPMSVRGGGAMGMGGQMGAGGMTGRGVGFRANQPVMVEGNTVIGDTVSENGYVGAVPSASPWHGGYYHTGWGRPVPLVVPPNASWQFQYGWGIGNTRLVRIDPQFQGPQEGYPFDSQETWHPQPFWPSDTQQFGVYYIRGPW